MIDAGLVEQLVGLGWKVNFGGHHEFENIKAEDDPPIVILKNPRLVSRVSQYVAKAVTSHVSKGHLPITLGGDHSLVCVHPNTDIES